MKIFWRLVLFGFLLVVFVVCFLFGCFFGGFLFFGCFVFLIVFFVWMQIFVLFVYKRPCIFRGPIPFNCFFCWLVLLP